MMQYSKFKMLLVGSLSVLIHTTRGSYYPTLPPAVEETPGNTPGYPSPDHETPGSTPGYVSKKYGGALDPTSGRSGEAVPSAPPCERREGEAEYELYVDDHAHEGPGFPDVEDCYVCTQDRGENAPLKREENELRHKEWFIKRHEDMLKEYVRQRDLRQQSVNSSPEDRVEVSLGSNQLPIFLPKSILQEQIRDYQKRILSVRKCLERKNISLQGLKVRIHSINHNPLVKDTSNINGKIAVVIEDSGRSNIIKVMMLNLNASKRFQYDIARELVIPACQICIQWAGETPEGSFQSLQDAHQRIMDYSTKFMTKEGADQLKKIGKLECLIELNEQHDSYDPSKANDELDELRKQLQQVKEETVSLNLAKINQCFCQLVTSSVPLRKLEPERSEENSTTEEDEELRKKEEETRRRDAEKRRRDAKQQFIQKVFTKRDRLDREKSTKLLEAEKECPVCKQGTEYELIDKQRVNDHESYRINLNSAIMKAEKEGKDMCDNPLRWEKLMKTRWEKLRKTRDCQSIYGQEIIRIGREKQDRIEAEKILRRESKEARDILEAEKILNKWAKKKADKRAADEKKRELFHKTFVDLQLVNKVREYCDLDDQIKELEKKKGDRMKIEKNIKIQERQALEKEIKEKLKLETLDVLPAVANWRRTKMTVPPEIADAFKQAITTTSYITSNHLDLL